MHAQTKLSLFYRQNCLFYVFMAYNLCHFKLNMFTLLFSNKFKVIKFLSYKSTRKRFVKYYFGEIK